MSGKQSDAWRTVSVSSGEPSITVYMHEATDAVLFRIGIAHVWVELSPEEALALCQDLEHDLERWAPEAIEAAYGDLG